MNKESAFRASEEELEAWENQGFDIISILNLVERRFNNLDKKLDLSSGRFCALLSLFDSIFKGETVLHAKPPDQPINRQRKNKSPRKRKRYNEDKEEMEDEDEEEEPPRKV